MRERLESLLNAETVAVTEYNHKGSLNNQNGSTVKSIGPIFNKNEGIQTN